VRNAWHEALASSRTRQEASASSRLIDAATAGVVALSAFTVYVVTLAPGLIGITDTPKFQFIGRILGTAHNPGYPLYVMVSHLFGYLPVGTLAYRINLMSAVFGAASCGLLYVCARQLDANRWVAACAGLGFGFGATIWYSATIAEVYTFNGCLVAAIVAALLAWQRSGRTAWFFGAVAVFALSLGLHTTVLFLVPAIALFACLVAPRFALRPKTIVAAAGIVALGLMQYLFIIIRTRQGAWVETPATTVADLARAITGSDYFRAIMPRGARQALTGRGPLVWQGFVEELSVAGVALALAGIIVLWRRSKPALALATVGLAPFAAFAIVYDVGLFHVFLVPAFVMSWLLAAAGAQGLADLLRARAGPRSAAAAIALVALIPAWQIVRNFETHDLSHSFADMRFFDALMQALPDRSALLSEDFLVDRMVYYKRLGEEAWRGRRVEAPLPLEVARIERLWREGYGIFAFPKTARLLRLFDGLEFEYSPVDLRSDGIDRYLAELPRGFIVAIAVPAVHLRTFLNNGHLPLEEIGYRDSLRGLDVVGVAVVGITGGRAAESVVHPINASLRLDARTLRLPLPIVVEAGQEVASIQVGGREVLRTAAGLAAASWRKDGGLDAAFVVPAASPRAPTPPTPLSVHRMRALRTRQTIGDAPVDLTSALATGNLIARTDTGRSHLVLYAGRRQALAPVLLDGSARSWPEFDIRSFTDNRVELRRSLDSDSMPADPRLLAMPYVYRVSLATDFSGPAGILFSTGGVPDVAYGRTVSGSPVKVYGPDIGSHLLPVDGSTRMLVMANNHHGHLVGAGWSPVQADAAGPYRETSAEEAELLLPMTRPSALRIGIQLEPRPRAGVPPLEAQLRFNGSLLPSIALAPGWRRYWWDVPAGVCCGQVNSAVIVVSPAGGRIAVSDLLIENR
jgi:Protein O-mannosyl-transferase TMEM260-like